MKEYLASKEGIVNVFVNEDDEVKAGDTLFTISDAETSEVVETVVAEADCKVFSVYFDDGEYVDVDECVLDVD